MRLQRSRQPAQSHGVAASIPGARADASAGKPRTVEPRFAGPSQNHAASPASALIVSGAAAEIECTQVSCSASSVAGSNGGSPERLRHQHEQIPIERRPPAQHPVGTRLFHRPCHRIRQSRNDPEGSFPPATSRRLSTAWIGLIPYIIGSISVRSGIAISRHPPARIHRARRIHSNPHRLESEPVVIRDQLILCDEEEAFHAYRLS